MSTLILTRACSKFSCGCNTFFATTSRNGLRWNSNKNPKPPGSSLRKVAKTDYNRKYFNFEKIKSKLKFKLPTKLEIIEFLWRGPKSLRIPDSAADIKAYRGLRGHNAPLNRQAYVFSFFRIIYPYMDNPAKNVMLYYRPTAFSALFATTSYVGCTIWSYEDKHSSRSGSSSGLFNNWKIPLPHFGPTAEGSTAVGMWVKDRIRGLRARVRHWWNYQATDADRLFWPIFAINGIVYLAWRLDVFASSMVPWFTSSPTSRYICTPFLFAAFSHYSFTHFALNMFVLHSFLPAAVSLLGKHYALYLYLTGGVLSSYGSHMFKMLKGTTTPSLGASGAIMAILGFVCTQTPDAKLGIVLIPGFTFSADTGLKCLMTMDFVGMLAGWGLMDHAAHFSGALFGILYSHASPHLEPFRELILNTWHHIRTFRR